MKVAAHPRTDPRSSASDQVGAAKPLGYKHIDGPGSSDRIRGADLLVPVRPLPTHTSRGASADADVPTGYKHIDGVVPPGTQRRTGR